MRPDQTIINKPGMGCCDSNGVNDLAVDPKSIDRIPTL